MKKLALLLCLVASITTANAGTVTITASGFTTLPASPPPGWPAGIVWPSGQSPNGTKTYTVNDADWQELLAWTAASQLTAPATPTAAQLLLSWVQIWINGTKTAVQQYYISPPITPPAISIQ